MREQAAGLIGQTFGNLTVVRREKRVPGEKDAKWYCKCNCGGHVLVTTSHWKRGQKNCPQCLSLNRKKHGMCETTEYKAWVRMVQRATNPNSPSAKYYLERGISVCDRWLLFENFFKDMGFAPTKKHTIDRHPNNDGNYEPGNVRWATMNEQSRNKRNNKIIEFNGQSKCLIEWCEMYGLEKRTLCGRLLKGWDVERAITTPVLRVRKGEKHKKSNPKNE